MYTHIISRPKLEEVPQRVIVFLPGVGEAFINCGGDALKKLYSGSPDVAVAAKLGLGNILNHGIPKILARPAASAPRWSEGKPETDLPFPSELLSNYLIIVVQPRNREDFSDLDVAKLLVTEAVALAKTFVKKDPHVILMGFSRGGYAALSLASEASLKESVRAVVSMDAASPNHQAIAPLVESVNKSQTPTWAFYADYTGINEDSQQRITRVHQQLRMTAVPFGPTNEARCTTVVPTFGDKGERHNQTCQLVTHSEVIYEWMAAKVPIGAA